MSDRLQDMASQGAAEARPAGALRDYLAIARFDHATKHVFIVPGVVLAFFLRGPQATGALPAAILALVAALAIASANYVTTEGMGRDCDKHHPTNSAGSAVMRVLDGRIVWFEWGALLALGLGCAALSSRLCLLVCCLFALQGVAYNLPPLRTKDMAFLDVISESVNNPIRLVIGWAMVDPTTLPPSSIILAYWSGGAFLMAAKRLSEYRDITAAGQKQALELYRASFKGYSELSLLVSCFAYALFSMFFLAVFLIKYRIEYLFLAPVLVILFAQYLALTYAAGSTAQRPERLFKERGLLVTMAALGVLFLLTTFVNMPFLSVLTTPSFIRLE